MSGVNESIAIFDRFLRSEVEQTHDRLTELEDEAHQNGGRLHYAHRSPLLSRVGALENALRQFQEAFGLPLMKYDFWSRRWEDA